MRETSRPPIIEVVISPPINGAIISPATEGEAPRTSWKKSGRKTLAPISAIAVRLVTMAAIRKTRLVKRCGGSIGSDATISQAISSARNTTEAMARPMMMGELQG